MLRHFVLAIFLIALALPAIAVASPPPANDVAMSEDCHGKPLQDQNGGDHESGLRLHHCIGCVTPANAAQPVAQPLRLSFIPFADPIRRLRGTTPSPGLPPPRH